MRVLDTIRGPEDLADLDSAELATLATEIRDFLVPAVCRTGGHLGPNLGVVELTLALHRVFDSPHDRIVWDTGHQSYVHKMLTGRKGDFATLRQPGGLSGYPSRAESPHDLVENSHASTALSYADGLAKAAYLLGEDRQVVAVIGDGGLTGGMAWEALNAIAGARRNVVVVVNDNGRSYAPTVGGLQEHLAALRVSDGYEQAQDQLRALLEHTPRGQQVYDTLRSVKRALKELLAPQPLFEDLGLKYLGPVDGHDLGALERALEKASNFTGPVIVHAITKKGMGYKPAEEDDDDCLHGVGKVDPVSGRSTAAPSTGWTDVMSAELVDIADERADVVGVTAAMLIPVGLKPLAEKHPERVFDVGIAEQHAVTSAAGLAMGGMHPVVCLYATFLNRAFDQMVMDVGLHGLPVTFCLDRAGVTGTDGPSHHGMWDLSIVALVPGMSIAVPRDATRLREALREAVAIADGPSAVRYPKGSVGEDVPALRRTGGVDVLREGRDVLLVAVGPLAGAALEAAALCAEEGIAVTVVDPRWVKPVDPALVELAARHRLVVTVEDGGRHGGAGALVAEAVADAGLGVDVRVLGLAQEYLEQGSRAAQLEEAGLGPRPIARTIVGAIAAETAPPRVQDRIAG